MNPTNQYGMNKLVANCPECNDNSLYYGCIPTSIKSFVDNEVLFCKNCKFVLSVDEFKKILFQV